MRNYVRVNRAVYNKIAEEYNRKGEIFAKDYEVLLRPFQRRLIRDFGHGASVMHLGCGTGLDMRVMAGAGFDVYGFDVSEKMVKVAERNVPGAKITRGDFLTKKIPGKFNGIVMFAFLHLFPKKDAEMVLRRAASLLTSGGYCIICEAKHSESIEGFAQKRRYRTPARRFRKFWTEEELTDSIKELSGVETTGFQLRSVKHKYGEIWMALTFRKTKKKIES